LRDAGRDGERRRAAADRARRLRRALVSLLLAGSVFVSAARAEDVVAVRFPHGTRDACSDPVTGSFTVRGPGFVTAVITLVPYTSLGFVPNIPVGFRGVGSDDGFAPYDLLPGAVAGASYQPGRKDEAWVDGVAIEFVTVHELADDREYAIEVQAVPQCRMLNQGVFFQEGQEVRFSVQAAGAWLEVRATSALPPIDWDRPAPDAGVPPLAEDGAQALPPGDVLTSMVWQFGRSDGTLLVAAMRLLPDGRIEGANNVNETRWAVADGALPFFDAAGAVSTRFDTFRLEGGRWVTSGPFLLWGDITHVLTEVP
jgi:hypothetical protein